MGIMDNVMDSFNKGADAVVGAATKGASAVKDAASNVLIENADFVKDFARLCTQGFNLGFHERNGGNLSYLLTQNDLDAVYKSFNNTPGTWVALEVCEPSLAGAFFLVTATGSYMQNIAQEPKENLGILEINAEGNAYRVVWGFAEGGAPTSEFPSHFMIHAIRQKATGGKSRVLYHAHPKSVIATTFVLPLDAKTFSRMLWKSMTECVMVFPEGVGVVPWMVPGGADIAKATAEQMETYPACIWAQHGVFASGETFDATLGLMHCIEKAADIYVHARSMNGGNDSFANTIPDEGLKQTALEYGVTLNTSLLEK